MPSFIATGKSPCASHPEWFGLACPNIGLDKNLEPCASCKLPSQYDDRMFSGPKRFHDFKPGGASNQYGGRADDKACEFGYTTIGDAIEAMLESGMTHQQVADSIDYSRPTVSRIAKGRR